MSNMPRFTLSEICENITDGSHFSPQLTNDGYPYITVRDIVEDSINFADCKYVNEQDYRKLAGNGCKPSKGDVLFSKDGTVGKVALVDTSREFVVLSSLAILRPDQSRVFPPYLKYALKSPEFLKVALGKKTGAAIRRIILRNLKSIEVPLPPLAEQKRIVALLDEAFACIDAAKAKTEASLADAEESFNSLIDSQISCASKGAHCVPLEDLCDKNRVITYGVIKLGEPARDGVYCLRCGNLKRLTIDLEGIRKIPDSLSKEYSRTVLRGGELLVNVRGTLGGVCVAPSSMSGWNVAREIAVVPLQPGAMSAEYLSYHVASTTSQAWLMGKRKGAAYVGINIEDIRRLPIYLPSRKEQERIAGVLSEAQRHASDLQNIYEKKTKKLLDLKSSLLTQAFAGELTA